MPVELPSPNLRNQSAPVLDDDRRVAERLDVVDQRRALVEALVGGEGRLQARVAALALERVEQAGLLAADVGALAAVHDQVERVVGAEDALAQVALLVGLGDGRVEDVRLQLVLAADEDEALVRAGRDRADDAALDQQVRVLLHQQPVLEGARLGLVGVAAEVLVHRALGDEATPSCPSRSRRRRGRAGPSPRARSSTVSGVISSSALRSDAVAAEALVDGDRVEAGLVDVGEQQARLGHSLLLLVGSGATLVPGSSGSGGIGRRVRAARPPRGRRAPGGPPRCRRPGGRPAPRRPRPLGARRRGQLVAGSDRPRPGNGSRPSFSAPTSSAASSSVERADVAAVDRRHRRHVAGAQALELAQLDVLEALLARLRARSPRRPPWRCAGGRRRWCRRTRSGRRPGWVRSMS